MSFPKLCGLKIGESCKLLTFFTITRIATKEWGVFYPGAKIKRNILGDEKKVIQEILHDYDQISKIFA